jgi:hypothetical protein
VREICREGLCQEGDVEDLWVQNALNRVRKKEAGDQDWDELKGAADGNDRTVIP